MPGLPATGTLSYNGYVFDGATHIEADVEFLYDDAGRTIIAHRHTITVDAIVAADSDLDDDVLLIRKRLGEAGRKLTFISKGFGDDLTAVGIVSDVDAGPFPQELSWKPLGDDKAAEIRWAQRSRSRATPDWLTVSKDSATATPPCCAKPIRVRPIWCS